MKNPPNIIFIMADDQGPWALGSQGNTELKTPNLDRLAAEGIKFDNFFCASPVCSPARASILTGTIPSAHGVHDWIRSGNLNKNYMDELGLENPYGGYTDEKMPIQYLAGLRTYTDALVEAGYTCALSGKWHLGDSLTPQHGFAKWFTIGKGGAHYYYPDIIEDGKIEIRNEYVTNLITEKAIDYIDELAEADNPFYLSVHYTAPHSPWEADQHPAEYIQMYEDCPFESTPDVPDHPETTVGPVYGTPKRRENLRGYYAAITAMDADIGKLLARLDEHGIRENTIVIFTSDNGMCMGHHGIWGKGNGTHPQNMFEPSIKVPFIFRHPGIEKPGEVVKSLAGALDIYPTILELAGIDEPRTKTLPGESLLPLMQASDNNECFSRNRAIYICEEYGPVRMIRTETMKYIHRYPYGPHELYDLVADPEEMNNLIDDPAYEETIVEMRQELMLWYRRYVNPDLDGSKEAVTGLGQMDRAGLFASQQEIYKLKN